MSVNQFSNFILSNNYFPTLLLDTDFKSFIISLDSRNSLPYNLEKASMSPESRFRSNL